jgi:hypothetical protein
MSEHHRWYLKAVAAEAALAAVIDAASRHNEMQEKMLTEGREGLQRLVNTLMEHGADTDLRAVSDCGYALGVALKFDMSPRSIKKKRGGA